VVCEGVGCWVDVLIIVEVFGMVGLVWFIIGGIVVFFVVIGVLVGMLLMLWILFFLFDVEVLSDDVVVIFLLGIVVED
ncbi:hypothetical protein DF186_24595, partial [Enterococcus hirae]